MESVTGDEIAAIAVGVGMVILVRLIAAWDMRRQQRRMVEILREWQERER